jgi:hypothetical protein
MVVAPVLGVAGFAILLVSSFIVWRRQGAINTSRAYMIGLFVCGAVLLAVGV